MLNPALLKMLFILLILYFEVRKLFVVYIFK